MENLRGKNLLLSINRLNKKTIILPLILTYILLTIIFSIINPIFFSIRNIGVLLIVLSLPGITALGETFVLLTRNVDLSVGSIIGVTSIMVAWLYNLENFNISTPLIIIIGILVGLIIGSINGYFVSILGVNSVVATMGTLAIFRGVAYITADKPLLIHDKFFNFIGRGYIFNKIPLVFIYMIIIFFIFYYILKFSKFGMHIYAAGSNSFVAKLYGINTKKIIFQAYIISGFTASITGILTVSQLSFGTGDIGLNTEFLTLIIIVLGGISIRGGKGSIVGVLIAIFISGSISNGLTLSGASYLWKDAFLGVILVIAIIIDSIKNRNVF